MSENSLFGHNMKSFMPDSTTAPLQDTPKIPVDDDRLFAAQLQGLKNTDPAFYAFLNENDKDLLNFVVPNTDTGSTIQNDTAQSHDEPSLPPHNDTLSRNSTKQLTSQLFSEMLLQCKEARSFRSFSRLVTAFHCATQSLCENPIRPHDEKNIRFLLKQKRKKDDNATHSSSAPGLQSYSKAELDVKNLQFRIPFNYDEEKIVFLHTYYDIVLNILEHMDSLACALCGLDADQPKSSGSDPIIPTAASCTPKLIRVLDLFWVSICSVLKHAEGHVSLVGHYVQQVLRRLGSLALLRWISPMPRHLLKSVINHTVQLWLIARRCKEGFLNVSSSAFFVLKRILSLLRVPEFSFSMKQLAECQQRCTNYALQEAQQSLLHVVQKRYFDLLQKIGMTWKLAPRISFLEHCVVELLCDVQDNVAYRVVFLILRRLGTHTRSVIRTQAHTTLSIKQGKKRKSSVAQTSFSQKRENQVKSLYHWSFLLTCRLVIYVIAKKPIYLRPLVFPLTCILSNVLKLTITNATLIPFTMQCVRLNCLLMNRTNVFISLGGTLMALGKALFSRLRRVASCDALHKLKDCTASVPKHKRYCNATHVGRRQPQPVLSFSGVSKEISRESIVRPPDVDMVLSLKQNHLTSFTSTETLVDRWLFICAEYYALVAHHPAFPEYVLCFLRCCTLGLNCKSDAITSKIKTLRSVCRLTAKDIELRRLDLDPLGLPPVLHIWPDSNVPLVKYYEELLHAQTEKYNQRLVLESRQSHYDTDAILPPELSNLPGPQKVSCDYPFSTAVHTDASQDSLPPVTRHSIASPTSELFTVFNLDSDSSEDFQTSS